MHCALQQLWKRSRSRCLLSTCSFLCYFYFQSMFIIFKGIWIISRFRCGKASGLQMSHIWQGLPFPINLSNFRGTNEGACNKTHVCNKSQQPWLTLLSSHKCLKWDILWRHLLPTKKLHACKYTHGHAGENKNKGSLHLWCHILVGTLLCVWELKLGPTCLLIDLTC